MSKKQYPDLSLGQFMAGVLGAGVGAFINHISGSPFIWFFIWISISFWAGFHFWPMGGIPRRGFCVSSIILLAVSIILFIFESPKPPEQLNVCLYVNGEHGEPLYLTNEYFVLPMNGFNATINDSTIKGFVVVPVLEGATNAEIRLGLPWARSVVENVGMKVVWPNNIHCLYDSNIWIEQLDDHPGHFSVGAEASIISPVKAKIFKPLIFDTTNVTVKANVDNRNLGCIPLDITVASMSSKPMALALKLVFFEMPGIKDLNNLPKPVAMCGTQIGKTILFGIAGLSQSNGQWQIIQAFPLQYEVKQVGEMRYP